MSVSKTFFTAGKAVFTVEVPKEAGMAKPHYTFKITRAKHGNTFFVAYMCGSDNYSNYAYLGLLNTETGKVTTTYNSRTGYGEAFTLVNAVLASIFAGESWEKWEEKGYTLLPSESCCRCGRRLTNPSSCATGVGPECESYVALGIVNLSEVPYTKDKQVAQLQYAYWMQGLKATLFALKDACLDAGFTDGRAEALVNATKKTMRKFKGGKSLPYQFLRVVRS